MQRPSEPIEVSPYPAENPLKLMVILIGAVIWIIGIISLIGIFYGILLGFAFLLGQMVLIATLRGNSVKLSRQQMPGLYNRVASLSKRIGLKSVPDAYLLQSGGVLNAFATRFGSRNFIVLYSDIIQSCGNNLDALDFIIAHELGHLHRGHLRWRFLKAPALFVPFLGTAYYRACEYTCDRYGSFACVDPKKRADGLCLLACGPRYVGSMNKAAFAEQAKDLNTVFMKLATWMASHPPLTKRVAAVDPSIKPPTQNELGSTVGAILLACLLFLVPIGGIYFGATTITRDIKKALLMPSFPAQQKPLSDRKDITQQPPGLLTSPSAGALPSVIEVPPPPYNEPPSP